MAPEEKSRASASTWAANAAQPPTRTLALKKALRVGAADFIGKPVRPALMQLRVALHLLERIKLLGIKESRVRIECSDHRGQSALINRIFGAERFGKVLFES